MHHLKLGHRYGIRHEVWIEWTGSPLSPISILKAGPFFWKLELSTSYPEFVTLQAVWLLYELYEPLELRNPTRTFGPQTAFVWVYEQRAIISKYNIKCGVLITVMERVYCVLRLGS